jgi:transcription elongation factor Elf1
MAVDPDTTTYRSKCPNCQGTDFTVPTVDTSKGEEATTYTCNHCGQWFTIDIWRFIR